MADDAEVAAVSSILGPDPTHFETLISHLMSTSNDQRSQAETLFTLSKQTDPNLLFTKLCHVLIHSQRVGSRAMSAILLRTQLTQDDFLIWDGKLNPNTKLTIKSFLLSSISSEKVKTILKKLCDTVSELAASLVPKGEWSELLPFMFECVSSEDLLLQESALLIFAQLAQFIGESLVVYSGDLHGVFVRCLGSGSVDVRIAALSGVVNFVPCLGVSDRDRFQDLWPKMMSTLNGGNEAKAQEALQLLIELAGTEPSFFRRQFVEVVDSMLKIADDESLEQGTRHLAIELIITLAEARDRAPPAMRRDLPPFIRSLFAILIRMLSDIQDEAAWHEAVNQDEEAGESSNSSVARECLDRLAIALGGDTIVPVALEQLPAYLDAPEWQKHLAALVALVALAQITEGCSMVMINNLEQVVTMVLNSFQDPLPRVRWAAINAIGQLSTYLGPHLQVQFHARVLPDLASAMDDFENPRIQAHAASAVLLFSENCTPDILPPYPDEIVRKLVVLLLNGKEIVQEGALTALASVADSAQVMEVLLMENDGPATSYMLQVGVNQHINIVLSRVQIEENIKERFRLCRILAKSFIELNGTKEKWGEDIYYFLEGCMTGDNPFLKETGVLILVDSFYQSPDCRDRRSILVMLEIILNQLIGTPLHDSTQYFVQTTFLRRFAIEDDGKVMESLCHMIATAFRLFGGENGNPTVFSSIAESLEKGGPTARSAGILLEAMLDVPLARGTRIDVRYNLVQRVMRELDEDIMKSLYPAISKAFRVFGEEGRELLLDILTLLNYKFNPKIRSRSVILLEVLLQGQPLAEDSQNMVKGALLSRVRSEKDQSVWKNLCCMVGKAFTMFGGEAGWPEFFPFILESLEYPTDAELRARLAVMLEKVLEEPLGEETRSRVKETLLRRVEREEDDRDARRRLCGTIAKASNLFGEWPELLDFLDRCSSGDNAVLREAAELITFPEGIVKLFEYNFDN